MALGCEQAACLPCDPDTLQGRMVGPWATARAANDLRWGHSLLPWSPSHCPQPQCPVASGPPLLGSLRLSLVTLPAAMGPPGIIQGHFVWTEGCGMRAREKGFWNSESSWRSRAQAREEHRVPSTTAKAERPIAQDFERAVAF